jgi:hypothetical protein
VSAFCSHHCSACGAHFTSLRAFDAHNPGVCDFPDDAPLVELEGVCAISDYDEEARPIRHEGVVVYQLAGAERVREFFRARQDQGNGAEAAPAPPVQLKRAMGVAA